MAKSKIIKDLANGTVNTVTALKRAKVLLSEIGNEEVQKWINYEIVGYPADYNLPDYRKARGSLFGSYFKGSMASHMTWTNVSIPLGNMPDDAKDAILKTEFREGVEALRQLVDSASAKEVQLGKSIPADFFPMIAHYNNDPYMIITSARVIVGEQFLTNIFSEIENRLLDILILLEKEFGNLDELDLDVTSKTQEELQKIADNVYFIVYHDDSIKIGDSNKISKSTIASSVE